MKKLASGLAAVILGSMMAVSSAATASPATSALTRCVADNTTGKDRKDLALWVFVAMSSHPEIKPYSKVTDTERDQIDKKLAVLATKLVTENCKEEAKAAIKSDGAASFRVAFGTLGRLAMQELMTNPDVRKSFSNYTKYIDKSKFDAAFK
ncbi:hypothetical protein [Celerinatantimonas sp. YJH-8]|uniref:hypothetical protein n=1 Tax=Celerinatantimonas sp. YJH-8 TaxID=3228714 RepID=UPI0038C30668